MTLQFSVARSSLSRHGRNTLNTPSLRECWRSEALTTLSTSMPSPIDALPCRPSVVPCGCPSLSSSHSRWSTRPVSGGHLGGGGQRFRQADSGTRTETQRTSMDEQAERTNRGSDEPETASPESQVEVVGRQVRRSPPNMRATTNIKTRNGRVVRRGVEWSTSIRSLFHGCSKTAKHSFTRPGCSGHSATLTAWSTATTSPGRHRHVLDPDGALPLCVIPWCRLDARVSR